MQIFMQTTQGVMDSSITNVTILEVVNCNDMDTVFFLHEFLQSLYLLNYLPLCCCLCLRIDNVDGDLES